MHSDATANETMDVELQVALNFVISYLYNKLPRTRVHIYGEELEQLLRLKFAGHWYPSNPVKGSAYRCVHLNSSEIDPCFELAAVRSGLDFATDIKNNLPSELSVWVDPGEVSYAIGGPDDKPGPVKVLFKQQNTKTLIQDNVEKSSIDLPNPSLITSNSTSETYMPFNPNAKDFLPKFPASLSMNDMQYSSDRSGMCHKCPGVLPPQQKQILPSTFSYSMRPTRRLYTVDEFISTKFGSTKLRTSPKSYNPAQWMQSTGYPQQQTNNANSFNYSGDTLSTSIDSTSARSFQPMSQHLNSSPSYSESSSSSSTSSSPDHVKCQMVIGQDQGIKSNAATGNFWMESFGFQPSPTQVSSSMWAGPSSANQEFESLSDRFFPSDQNCIQHTPPTSRMMSMAS